MSSLYMIREDLTYRPFDPDEYIRPATPQEIGEAHPKCGECGHWDRGNDGEDNHSFSPEDCTWGKCSYWYADDDGPDFPEQDFYCPHHTALREPEGEGGEDE